MGFDFHLYFWGWEYYYYYYQKKHRLVCFLLLSVFFLIRWHKGIWKYLIIIFQSVCETVILVWVCCHFVGSEEGVVVVTTQALQKEKKWRERKLFFCVICQLLWAGNANAKCVAVAVVVAVAELSFSKAGVGFRRLWSNPLSPRKPWIRNPTHFCPKTKPTLTRSSICCFGFGSPNQLTDSLTHSPVT